MNTQLFDYFAPIIKTMTTGELSSGPTLRERLRIAGDGDIEVCYAPLEFVNEQAKVVIVGITPGMTQMTNTVAECRRQLDLGKTNEQALFAAKMTGAFSGAMRNRLIALLEHIGLAQWLGIAHVSELFTDFGHLADLTSLLRNPVFVRGANYNGTPNMTRHPLLRSQLLDGFAQSIQQQPNAIFIPLGDKVGSVLDSLAAQGLLSAGRIFHGIPHPSGANNERISCFLGKIESPSRKTNRAKLDQARESLRARVLALS